MIVVDSSVWIDYFNGADTVQTDVLDGLLGTTLVLVGDLIVVEVLQGFRADADFARARVAMTSFPVIDMVGSEAALDAAQTYRLLRKRGITVRKTIDVLIASACLRHGHALLFTDRDFQPFVEHLGLVPA